MTSDHFYCCISGILFSTLVFGPACGFILGSVCTNFYVDALFIDTSEFQFFLCISKYNTNTQFRTTENCCEAFCFPLTRLLHLLNNWKHKASYSVSLSRSIISERINWKWKGQRIFHTFTLKMLIPTCWCIMLSKVNVHPFLFKRFGHFSYSYSTKYSNKIIFSIYYH